ncbi:MAG: STAS domain-containing protein [Streptosporangiaceae bacterium]
MDADDLTVEAVRDGAVCTLILAGVLDVLVAGEFLQRAARALDDRIERFVLDLAGVTFLDCAGVRALATATCFAPEGCPVIIGPLSPPARRIITVLGTDDIESLRRLTAGLPPRDGLRDGVAGERELVPVTWGDLDLGAPATISTCQKQ